MGHTFNEFPEDERKIKKAKSSKHARNIPGKGMRVINSWYEEDEDDYFDDDVEASDEVSIVHTKQR